MKFTSQISINPGIRLFLLLMVLTQLTCLSVPFDPVVGWPGQTNEIIFSTPAIGPNGGVVFGTKSGDIDLPGGPDGNVYLFNPNGTLRWKFSGTDWFESSPVIAEDGTVYIGGWDNYLYAINGQTGIKIWDFQTEGAITATPAIGPDSTIYVGSTDGRMYAVWPDNQERWVYETDPDLLSPVYGGAVFNDAGTTLYFGDDDGKLHALNASTGQPLWTYSVPPEHDLVINPGARAIAATPALDSQGNIYFTCENGYLYMLNSSGVLLNAFGASDSNLSSPVIDTLNRVYFSSRDTYMYCLAQDNTGILDSEWETNVGDVLYCTPAIDALGNIFVAGYTGDSTSGVLTTFSSLDSSGTLNWSDTISSINDSSPNIAPDGSIYIGAYNGEMYKLEGLAHLAGSGWPRLASNRRQTGWHPDLNHFDLIDYFPDITHQLSYLSYVPWFGAGWINELELPDIEHIEHGNLYIGESSSEGVIYFDYALVRWVFAYRNHPDYLFDLQTRAWLYHAQGTTATEGRWFYSFASSGWVKEADL